MKYDVKYNEKLVGEIVLQEEGLYYTYRCNCNFDGNKMHRILMIADNRLVNLGICVPVDGGYETHGRIPAKQISGAELAFAAVTYLDSNKYSIVDSKKSFRDMEHLERGRMIFVDNKAIMVIRH